MDGTNGSVEWTLGDTRKNNNKVSPVTKEGQDGTGGICFPLLQQREKGKKGKEAKDKGMEGKEEGLFLSLVNGTVPISCMHPNHVKHTDK